MFKDNGSVTQLQNVLDRNIRELFAKKHNASRLADIVNEKYLPEKHLIKKGKGLLKIKEHYFPQMKRELLLAIIELIYKVRQAYYHEWDVEYEGGVTNKRDFQIV